MKSKQTAVRIPISLYEKTKKKSESMAISVGAVIRIALTEYLSKCKRK